MKITLTDLFAKREKSIYRVRYIKGLNEIVDVGELTTSFVRQNGTCEMDTQLHIFTQHVTDKAVLQATWPDFNPSHLAVTVTMASRTVSVEGKYEDGKVIIDGNATGDRSQRKLNVGDNAIDHYCVLYYLRAVALGLRPSKEIAVVNVTAGQCVTAKVEPAEEQNVFIELGEFRCTGVKLSFPEIPQIPPQKFLFDINAPYRLILNTCGAQVMEVMKIE